MSIILENLPDVEFAMKDTEAIKNELIADVEGAVGRKLYPADPMRLFLLALANQFVLLRSRIDYAAKQNLLKYAGEGFLENLAAFYGVERLQPGYALTTLRFTVSMPGEAVLIPKGTRVTAGDKVYFETLGAAEVQEGDGSAIVHARCTLPGALGNGYLPGQVTKIVDPFLYFKSVENITVSQGGVDLECPESLRERTRLAPERFSTAGPGGAYEFWAKSASQLIVDVSVASPSPGVVEVIPLLRDGGLPTAGILDAVYQECRLDTRRPLTDKVVVRCPVEKLYDIDIKYFISKRDSASGLAIQSNAGKAVQEYVSWQKGKLGRDINPSELIRKVMGAGAKRVEVSAPAFEPVDYYEVAVNNRFTFDFGGLEDE